MSVYAWNIFLENAIKIVSIFPSYWASEAETFRNHHHFTSSCRTQWKHLVFINEPVPCINVCRIPFSVTPVHRTVHQKNESWTDGNSLIRKIQMCCSVKCTRVSGNVHWCSVYMLAITTFEILILASFDVTFVTKLWVPSRNLNHSLLDFVCFLRSVWNLVCIFLLMNSILIEAKHVWHVLLSSLL